jgi:hypothetical protein
MTAASFAGGVTRALTAAGWRPVQRFDREGLHVRSISDRLAAVVVQLDARGERARGVERVVEILAAAGYTVRVDVDGDTSRVRASR